MDLVSQINNINPHMKQLNITMTKKNFWTKEVHPKIYEIEISGTTHNPFFNAKDVCDMLKFSDIRDAVEKHVDVEDVKTLQELINEEASMEPNQRNYVIGKSYMSVPEHEGKWIYISKTGFYSLVLSSPKRYAREFKWAVCRDILSQISSGSQRFGWNLK